MSVQGADLPHALLDYIRNNDVAVLEGCDKVRVYIHRYYTYHASESTPKLVQSSGSCKMCSIP